MPRGDGTEIAASPRRVNRRLTARRTCHLTVRYRGRSEWHPATAMDLSRHGCRLRIGEDLYPPAQLEVSLEAQSPSGTASVELRGRVIWARPEGISHQVGVQFTHVPVGLDQILSLLS